MQRYCKILTYSLLAILLQGCVTAAVVTVVGGATVVNDRRSLGHQIDDQTIEFNAYKALAERPELKDNAHIQVVSVNGTVLAVGQVTTQYLRDLVVKTLTSIDGILQFHNQIKIGNPTSLLTRSHDTWLTTKVKAALFSAENLDATNIKVITENGEVFLMGLVSEQEANEAANIARNISGVTRVYKAFEIKSNAV
jgi:osmotically-inducible protein OsmY